MNEIADKYKLTLGKMGRNLLDYYFKNERELKKEYDEYCRTKHPAHRLGFQNFVKDMFKIALAMGFWTPKDKNFKHKGIKVIQENPTIIQF